MIEVLKAGLLTTIQDLGRSGYAHLGVGRSGALDAVALRLANRLVGNAPGAACLETTLTGVAVRTDSAVTAAVTGAPAPVTVDGETTPFGEPFAVGPGAVIEVGPAEMGVRSYLAFAGGVTVAPVLGSRSTDTLSGLGPPPLRGGFVLPIGHPSPHPSADEDAATPNRSSAHGGALIRGGVAAEVEVRVRMGPRHDWFSIAARDVLRTGPYTLSVKTNRVGARLAGPPLSRTVSGELPSEGIVLGAIQVPADGQPLVFLADHPTTGGYPVIGVVHPADLVLFAQARPGTAVRFITWT